MLSFHPFVEIGSKQASDVLFFNLLVGAPVDQQLRHWNWKRLDMNMYCPMSRHRLTVLPNVKAKNVEAQIDRIAQCVF